MKYEADQPLSDSGWGRSAMGSALRQENLSQKWGFSPPSMASQTHTHTHSHLHTHTHTHTHKHTHSHTHLHTSQNTCAWMRLCIHACNHMFGKVIAVALCVYVSVCLVLAMKTSIVIWLKLPLGVHEAHNGTGLPEIQYVNPLRASAQHILVSLSCFCATSALRETDKELEKNNRAAQFSSALL